MNASNRDLTKAYLMNYVLNDSFFTFATLNEADFSGSVLTNTSFEEAALTDAVLFESVLIDANFTSSTLVNANLSGSMITGANFTSAVLENTNFTDAIMTGADFNSATFINPNFTGAIIAGANFGAAVENGFTFEHLTSTGSYAGRNLMGINLSNNLMIGWDFEAQILSGANMAGANLCHANLHGAALDAALFEDSTIAGADFSSTTARGFTADQLYSTASYSKSELKNLRGINLGDNDLSEWILDELKLVDAVFRIVHTHCGILARLQPPQRIFFQRHAQRRLRFTKIDSSQR